MYSPWKDLLGHHQLVLRRSLPAQFTGLATHVHRPVSSNPFGRHQTFHAKWLTWFEQPRRAGPRRGRGGGEVAGEQLALARRQSG